MKVGVIGGGTFGRALASQAARAGNDVILSSRRAPGDLPRAVRTIETLAPVAEAQLIFLAIPSEHIPDLATTLRAHLDGHHMLVHVSRGLIGSDLRPLSSVLSRATACRRIGALAGPLVGEALARGAPGGGIVGTLFPEVAKAVRAAIGGPTLRIYETDDLIGVELASALVGLLVLVAGFGSGLNVGPSALGVVCARGIAEAQRVGVALGARERTFAGLAGFGDLVAAVGGDDRPEWRLGVDLARGQKLADAAPRAGSRIEGVTIARRVADFGTRSEIATPIAQAVAEVLDGNLSAAAALEQLMVRQQATE